MSIILSPIIDTFLKAKNEYDSRAFTACFTEGAIVEDEGRKISGKAAIQKWFEDSSAKYRVTVTAERIAERDNETILTAQVSGDFEGSPVLLDYHMVFSEGKISRLDIQLTDE